MILGVKANSVEKQYANGDIYEGEMKNGQRSGLGHMRYGTGGAYRGDWKDGKRHG